jgi:hypothetical protein
MINIGTIQVTPNEDSTIISDGKHTQKERSESTMQQEPTTSGVSKVLEMHIPYSIYMSEFSVYRQKVPNAMCCLILVPKKSSNSHPYI